MLRKLCDTPPLSWFDTTTNEHPFVVLSSIPIAGFDSLALSSR